MEQYIYALLDTKTNICVGTSYLSGEVTQDNMILIDVDTAKTCLGKKYANGVWEEVPKEPEPEPTPQPTNLDIMEKLEALEGTAVNEAIDNYTAQLIESGVIV